MTKFQLLAAAAAAALATACAGSQSAQTERQNLASASSSATTARSAPATSTPAPATTPSTQAQTATPAPTQQAQATPAPTTPVAPTTYTDEQLRSFARAAIEIDPISRTLANATPEQTTAATEQIRQILARNNIDSATYNAIASRAQTDTALAQRIAALNRTDQSSG